MDAVVLDAWAIMAWLKGQQPGAGKVRLLLDAADRRERKLIMNIINLGEVFYLAVKAKDLAYGDWVLKNLRPRITIVSASDEFVMDAAVLKSRYPISYADAFAAATAIAHESPLVTGDPELRAMAGRQKSLKLEWIAG